MILEKLEALKIPLGPRVPLEFLRTIEDYIFSSSTLKVVRWHRVAHVKLTWLLIDLKRDVRFLIDAIHAKNSWFFPALVNPITAFAMHENPHAPYSFSWDPAVGPYPEVQKILKICCWAWAESPGALKYLNPKVKNLTRQLHIPGQFN
ncbi:hypothetical protein N7462_004279 [Penicillium macrosclerotiorum]|uniref:uncharacterized protein n=1 Tax=Penicillium macrosclerotiorum TaxID=303699 RepID=UPI002548867D|nr:uncharacterized protein N7462_004279 [Penicillium macrosclerotiorum]KAJ5689887.1 hypothetical protein N7462_004279 [Penicillium macrosclerotiorum]